MTDIAHSTQNPKRILAKTWADVLVPITAQQWRVFKASFAHLVTTGMATAIVMALFMFIFSDFIQQKMPQISPKAAESARFYFLALTIIFSGLTIHRWCRSIIYSRHSWINFLTTFGQSDEHLQFVSTQTSLILVSMGMATACAICGFFLGPISEYHVILAVIVVASSVFFLRRHSHLDDSQKEGQKEGQKELPQHSSQTTMQEPLVAWRSSRMMTNAWRGSSLRILAALPVLFGTTSLAARGPEELTYIACLAGGIILSWTVPLLIEDDLRSTWIERQAAVSHKDWLGAWQKIFTQWTRPLFATTAVLCIFSSAVTLYPGFNLTSEFAINTARQAAISGLLVAFPVWLAPAFVMQIDGRRVMTNIVMLTLVGLFVGTAIIALPIIAPATFLLHREAHRYQEGRFARGSNN